MTARPPPQSPKLHHQFPSAPSSSQPASSSQVAAVTSSPPTSPSASSFRSATTSQGCHSHSRSSSSSSCSSRTASVSSRADSSQPQLQQNKQPRAKISIHNMRLYTDERPPSPLKLTSSLAQPSVIPMTAAGVSAKSSSPKKSRRSPAAGLKLSMLPPARSVTSASSTSITSAPSTAVPGYSLISSCQAYSHTLSAQQQLQLHQKEIIQQATRATGIPAHLLSSGPISPRLIPLGSPGPVTPLDLLDDNQGGYLMAGSPDAAQLQQQLAYVAAGKRH